MAIQLLLKGLQVLWKVIAFLAVLAKNYIPAHYLKWVILAIPAIIGSVTGQIFGKLIDLSKWLTWLFIRFFFWLLREIVSLAWLLIGIGVYASIALSYLMDHGHEIPKGVWLVAIVWPFITIAWNHIVHLIQDDVPI